MGKHPNFKRANLTFEVKSLTDGYYIYLIEKDVGPLLIQAPFETEELAGRAGQAILDYAYGTPRQMTRGDSRTSKGTGMKGAEGVSEDLQWDRIRRGEEKPPSIRKAPRKAPKKKGSESAATASPARIEQSDHQMFGGGN